jgi:chromosome segregation ATPase
VLTNAKDHERLALFKEVAGTKVYEQWHTVFLRIMAETGRRKLKIIELFEFIETRLGEPEESKEFQEKERRALPQICTVSASWRRSRKPRAEDACIDGRDED